MRHVSEVEADARDEPAFSNGTQGYGWMANWCDRCVHDDLNSNRYGVYGCPIIAVTMLSKTPIEFLCETEEQRIFADYHCIEFRDKDDPGPTEPTPIPDPPGQELLLPREPFEATRMLTGEVDLPAVEKVPTNA